MSTAFTIRDARAGERAAIAELTRGVYNAYAEIMAPSAWEGLRQAMEGALASADPAERIVAEQGGQLVGSVMLFPPAAGGAGGGRMVWPELRMLAVAPAARGQGIGRALVAACIERARRLGYPALGLYSSQSMQTAIALYGRMGFVPAPEYNFQPPGAELIQAFRYDLP